MGVVNALRGCVPYGARDLVKRAVLHRWTPGLAMGRECTIVASAIGRSVTLRNFCKLDHAAVGDHTYLEWGAWVVNATVGKYCSLGPHCVVGLSAHPMDGVSSHPRFYKALRQGGGGFSEQSPEGRVVVGSDVWIGHGAMVKAGLRVGHGAVIGAGAVVTHDVEPYTVVAGIPARVLQTRFPPDVVDGLLRVAWWDRAEEWVAEHFDLFADPYRLLELCGAAAGRGAECV